MQHNLVLQVEEPETDDINNAGEPGEAAENSAVPRIAVMPLR